jgi:hypothetical protein
MSIFSKIKKVGKKALKGAVGGVISGGNPVLGALGGALGTGASMQNVRKSAGSRTLATSLAPMPTSSRLPTTVNGGFGGSGASGSWGAPGAGYDYGGGATYPVKPRAQVVTIDPYTGMPRRRRRRMNVMNVRAARRAIRRIRGARKMLQRIERSLPKSHPRARARAHH